MSRPGISQEFLQAAGVHLLQEPEAQLRIPYHDFKGVRTGHWRSRLLNVRATGQKYDQPPGSGLQVYFCHLPLTPGPKFFVTEGEFKALALCEAGYMACGLGGLHCYTRDINDNPQILPALWDAVRFVAPAQLYFVGDSDTWLNLEYYRSAQFLAVTFPSVTVHLLRLAPGGPKGIDDLRAALGERFPTWLEDALAKTLLLEPEQSFLFPALIGLETIAELIPKLPAMERERTIQRLVQMTAFARAAKDQPRLAVERFCEIAQKVSRLTKAAFEKSVEDELLRICAQFQSSTGPEAEQNTPPGFDETVEPWLEPVDGEPDISRTFACSRLPVRSDSCAATARRRSGPLTFCVYEGGEPSNRTDRLSRRSA
jgi:hypothetical protein